MFGKFDDQVAPKEPSNIARSYGILMKKVAAMDTEQNRLVILTDFATGHPMSANLRRMQHEVLPSVKTKNIKIEYQIEAIISHEGMFTASQDVPSLIFPLHVTVDPQGPFDLGREGHLESEEKRQMEQAIKESQVAHRKHLVRQQSNDPYPNLDEEHKSEEPQANHHPAAGASKGR